MPTQKKPRALGKKKGVNGAMINKATFENLCNLLCTEQEICGVLGVSHDTLLRWIRQEYGKEETFTSTSHRFGSERKKRLREIQFKLAEENSAMAIFLGKQYLGQRDVVEQTNIERVSIVSDMPTEDVEDED